jgi:hypothetical protein
MTVQQIPLTKQQIKVELQEINPWVRNPQKKKKGKNKKNAIYNIQATEQKNLHGPKRAIPVANNDPKSWPSVAPAPMNPNNLEPD